MRQILILAMVLGFLSGCGSSGRWVKDDMSQRDADGFDCEFKSSTMNARERDQIIRAIAITESYSRCMRSKGYYYQK